MILLKMVRKLFEAIGKVAFQITGEWQRAARFLFSPRLSLRRNIGSEVDFFSYQSVDIPAGWSVSFQ